MGSGIPLQGIGESMTLNILFEDADIIVCEKPAGVPAQSDKTGDYDMVNYLKNYIFEKDSKTIPYIGLIHRLDRPVGGIMVFAKSQQAAKVLSEQLRTKQMKKHYVAVVTGDLSNRIGKEKEKLEDYIVKDGKTNLSKFSTMNDKNAKKAELYYRVIGVLNTENSSYPVLSLVEVELLTGRHHQIRIQLSKNITGLWGDTKYNKLFSQNKGWTNIALYAYRIEFVHPINKKKLEFALVPESEPFQLFPEELKTLV